MDKETNGTINNYNHGITVVERKSALISGVKRIESFDDEEFLMETVMGYLVIKGDSLELIKLDTLQGNVSIKGLIKSFAYIEEGNKKDKENGIINRLFK
ncbi:MAG: sporulation protein YabP [Bacilli bacterium]